VKRLKYVRGTIRPYKALYVLARKLNFEVYKSFLANPYFIGAIKVKLIITALTVNTSR